MKQFLKSRFRRVSRRGATFAVTAFFVIIFMCCLAISIDFGRITLAKTQLQATADAAALAATNQIGAGTTSSVNAAQEYVSLNQVGGPGETATLDNSDIVFGLWDKNTSVFTPGNTGANAIRVKVKKHLSLFFGPVYGPSYVDLEADATALTGPRDIAFVIDLSGSMNNDTEIWATNAINSEFPGYPTIGTQIMSDVFSDLNYGSYPGTLRHVGQGLSGAPNNDTSYSWLANTYLMNNSNVSTTYRVLSTDSSSTRKTKAYRWIIDYQLATIMPNALPAPNSATNLSYWTQYLDYIIKPYNSLPPNQNSYRISTGSNPYGDAWPELTSSTYTGFQNKLGYQTYVQFMMDYGRNRDVTGTTNANLSTLHPEVVMHTDSDVNSPGYGLSFPPREQPTHAVRLALMAAVNLLANINAGRPETIKDHVCLITFDTASGSVVRYPLSTTSCDYNAVKSSIRTIQACADDTANTASEAGLLLARNHLNPATNPSGARPGASKVVVFLSDGIANAMQSSSTTISNFTAANPSSEWYTSGSYRNERNAAIMQVFNMQSLGFSTYAVGVGLGADYSLMDRLARVGGTAKTDPNNPDGPKISMRTSGNPGDYQALLTSIFGTIVSSPTVQLGE